MKIDEELDIDFDADLCDDLNMIDFWEEMDELQMPAANTQPLDIVYI